MPNFLMAFLAAISVAFLIPCLSIKLEEAIPTPNTIYLSIKTKISSRNAGESFFESFTHCHQLSSGLIFL